MDDCCLPSRRARRPLSRRVRVPGPRRPHCGLCLRKNPDGKGGHAARQRLEVPKETFSNKNEEYQNGVKTSTHLQAAKPPPKEAFMIAVLADAKEINELALQEVQDEAVTERIGRYIKSAKELNLDPDIRLLKTRLLRASPTVLLSESFVASPNDEAAMRKQLPKGCDDCEIVPLWVGQDLVDLFKSGRSTETNSVEHTCGGIK